MKITKQKLEQLIKEEISSIYADNGSISPNAEVPAIDDENRAQELLNSFKNMLKPEEQQIKGSCGTFLRQLAALADRMEAGGDDANGKTQ